jgi:hypothetical protein
MADLIEELDKLSEIIADAATGLTNTNPNLARIQQIQSDLSKALAKARRVAADNATPLFVHGNTTLVQVNKQLKADINSLADLEANIMAITGVIDAAVEFLAIFAPAPA